MMSAEKGLTPSEIALAFVEKINSHDVEGLCKMMSPDHLFTDSLGTKVRGRENMRKAWLAYFHMVPDFSITISNVLSKGESVGLFGESRGTFSPDGTLREKNRWAMPSAWRVMVRGQAVAEWQVYADNEPVRQLMTDHPA